MSVDALNLTPTDATRRDRWGRYLVVPPEGGKPTGYSRATTIAKAIEDQHSLIAWKARMTAKGLTMRPDLLKLVATTDDRKALDDLCEQAADVGGSTARRNEGTALHAAIEASIKGQPVPGILGADVDAFHAALAAHGLEPIADLSERIVVLDGYRVAGTFDLAVRHGGTVYVLDIKTGASVTYGGLAWATQLAIYANASALYTQGGAADGSDDRREPTPPFDRTVALIAHIQPDSARCDLHALDIAAGWETFELAVAVRAARSRRDWLTPFASPSPHPAGEGAPAPTPDEKTGEASTPGHVTSEGAPATRLAWISDRITALPDPQRAALSAHWPEGIAKPRQVRDGASWDDKDVELLDDLIGRYERTVEAPFAGGDPEAPRADKPEPVAPPARQTIDEGDTVTEFAVSAVASMLTALDTTARAAIAQITQQAFDAGVAFNLRANPTERRYALAHALLTWADQLDADPEFLRAALEHVTADVQPGLALGAIVGALDIHQAFALRDAIEQVCAGRLALLFGDDGHGRLVAA